MFFVIAPITSSYIHLALVMLMAVGGAVCILIRFPTRNIKLNPDDITKYEKRLKGIGGNSLLFSKSVRKIEIVVRNGRRAISRRISYRLR